MTLFYTPELPFQLALGRLGRLLLPRNLSRDLGATLFPNRGFLCGEYERPVMSFVHSISEPLDRL